MIQSTGAEQFDELSLLMINEDERVTRDGTTLLFRGVPFARLADGVLEVRLPASRAGDLAARNITRERQGGWTIVRDQSLWAELSDEARDFVGEPPVGHQS